MGVVTPITTLQQFEEIKNGDIPAVIDFWATWCGPCKMIAPVFEKLAANTPGVGFYKVDTDDAIDIAQKCGVSAMPTFILFHKGEKIDECKGAIPANLQKLVTASAALLPSSDEAKHDDSAKHHDSVTDSTTIAAGDDGGAAAAAAAAAASAE